MWPEFPSLQNRLEVQVQMWSFSIFKWWQLIPLVKNRVGAITCIVCGQSICQLRPDRTKCKLLNMASMTLNDLFPSYLYNSTNSSCQKKHVSFTSCELHSLPGEVSFYLPLCVFCFCSFGVCSLTHCISPSNTSFNSSLINCNSEVSSPSRSHPYAIPSFPYHLG